MAWGEEQRLAREGADEAGPGPDSVGTSGSLRFTGEAVGATEGVGAGESHGPRSV